MRNRCHVLAKRLLCHCDVQTVCLRGSMIPLGHPAPQLGDSFHEKLLKIVATRGEIFSLKFTKIPFGGRAPPGPAGGAKASQTLYLQ